MKLKLSLAVIALMAVGLAFSATTASAQQPPTPTSGKKIAGDLISPRGIKMGPDGMIYVAEAGSGGTTDVGSGDSASKSGLTGRISKIDPATGTRTTVAANLPSNAGPEGDAVGPADVAFIGPQLYYVQTHGGAAYGFPSNPTGVYKVNSNGTVTLVGDIGTFNINNPIADVKSGAQQDIEIGGNPYGMVVRDGAFYVSDGNQNQIEKVTTAGTVTRMAEFSGHPVLTGITYSGSGPFFVGGLGQGPFLPQDGHVFQVGYPSGSISTLASGFSMITGVALSSSSQLYALQFAEFSPTAAGSPFVLGSGKVLKVNSDGTFTPIVSGFSFATSMIFSGDTLYVTNFGVSLPEAPGEIWAIPNFSSIAPLPAPTPTVAAPAPQASPTAAVAPTGISAPNTGSGPDGDAMDVRLLVLALAAVGVVALAAGSAVAKRR